MTIGLRSITGFLARPILMFFLLPWLMVLVVLGTVAQRYIGLYASQKLFFGSFVLWAGILPLPGAYTALSLIAVSIMAKLSLKSPLGWRQSGTILAHVSMLVLLLGGLVTALGREDGYVVLGDGDSSGEVADYRLRGLVISKNNAVIATVPYTDLRQGDTLSVGAPFTLQVLQTCFPCVAHPRLEVQSNLRGVARKMELARAPYAKEDVQNISGAEILVQGVSAGQEGIYLAFEGLAAPESFTLGKDRYTVELAPLRRSLPFSVRLLHFSKSDYPGTDEAQAYRSDVTVQDGALAWKTTIEMNQPLRYKGYTLYQSSFVKDGDKLLSVLAVVKNAGGWFPYLALALLCTGLLVHIFITLSGRSDDRPLSS